MANNCLITTLKKEVDNDSLRKVGEIKFHVNNLNNNVAGLYLNFTTETEASARIVGDCHFTNSSGSEDKGKTISSSTGGLTMFFSAGEADVFVTRKYDFNGITIEWDVRTNGSRIELDFEELIYSNKFVSLDFGVVDAPLTVYGDVTNSNAKIYSLKYQYNNTLKGSLDKIVKNSDPEHSPNPSAFTSANLYFANTILSLDLSALAGKKFNVVAFSNYVTGDIKYIADTLDTNINISELAAPNITGTIENFVSRAIANGKTAGSMKFNYTSPKNFTNVTYGGIALSSNSNVPTPTGSQQVSFSWDSQGNVTWSVS